MTERSRTARVATERTANPASRRSSKSGNRTTTAYFDPDAMAPPFDFINELEQNLDAYEAPDHDCSWLSIPNLPGYIVTALDCCRANCKTVKTPPQGPTIVCAISHGIDAFFEDEEIDRMSALKKDIHRMGGKVADSNLLEMASEFFRRFPLGLPATMSQSKRVNVPMPLPIKKSVAERASELGLGIAAMAVLAILVTVSEQTVVHPKHAALASETIENFFRHVRLRRKIAQVILEEVRCR